MNRRNLAAAVVSTSLALGGCAVSDKGIAALPDRPVLLTIADVTVSDGTQYSVTTGYGPHGAFYKAVYPDRIVHYSTDGETAYSIEGGERTEIPESYIFHIESQLFHAQVSEFAELNEGVSMIRSCGTEDAPCREKIGNEGSRFFGVHYRALQADPRTGIPFAILAYRKGQSPVFARFSDWRTVDSMPLAYRVVVDDGVRTFDYRYRSIEGL